MHSTRDVSSTMPLGLMFPCRAWSLSTACMPPYTKNKDRMYNCMTFITLMHHNIQTILIPLSTINSSIHLVIHLILKTLQKVSTISLDLVTRCGASDLSPVRVGNFQGIFPACLGGKYQEIVGNTGKYREILQYWEMFGQYYMYIKGGI